MANTKFLCTDDDIAKIEAMASYGLNMEQIASIFNINKKTIERHSIKNDKLQQAISRGRAKAEYNVSKVAYSMAVSGNQPAMTMFWLKCRAGWREVIPIEHSGTVRLEDIVASDKDQGVD